MVLAYRISKAQSNPPSAHTKRIETKRGFHVGEKEACCTLGFRLWSAMFILFEPGCRRMPKLRCNPRQWWILGLGIRASGNFCALASRWLWICLRESGFMTITKIRVMRIGVLCVATLMYARVQTCYCQCGTEIPGKNSQHLNGFCGGWSVGSLLLDNFAVSFNCSRTHPSST